MELSRTKYKIYCNFDLNVNFCSLNYLYLPIIGSNAYILYNWLTQEIHLQRALFRIKSSHERIFLSLGFDEETFIKSRNNLEAMNLLISRVMLTENGVDTYIYELVQPLSFEKFIDNYLYKSLLINKITLTEFERLSLVLKNYPETPQGINVSSTFEMVYNTPPKHAKVFDMKTMEDLLAKKLKKKVVITSEVADIVETFFRVYNLSTHEMQKQLLDCIITVGDDSVFIDPENLREKLINFVEKRVKKIKLNSEVHRDVQIFDGTLSKQEEAQIVNDYLNFNCEQYLSIVQKDEINDEQRKLLTYLKQKLSDSMINIIIDYSVYKTHGRLNENYLKKLAKSINLLNFKTVHDVLHYLQQITIGVKHVDFRPINSYKNSDLSEEDDLVLANLDKSINVSKG